MSVPVASCVQALAAIVQAGVELVSTAGVTQLVQRVCGRVARVCGHWMSAVVLSVEGARGAARKCKHFLSSSSEVAERKSPMTRGSQKLGGKEITAVKIVEDIGGQAQEVVLSD